MSKKVIKITSPDDLNKNLSYSSPMTWITLTAVIGVLVAFFVWALTYNIKVKLFGTANVVSGQIALNVQEEKLKDLRLEQKVYIADTIGTIMDFDGKHQPVVYVPTTILDGEYEYYIVLKEMKPFDFWFNNN